MELNTGKFILQALNLRLPDLFPNRTNKEYLMIAEKLREAMPKKNVDDLVKVIVKEHALDEGSPKAIDTMFYDIGSAITGMGMDIEEDDAVSQIVWSK